MVEGDISLFLLTVIPGSTRNPGSLSWTPLSRNDGLVNSKPEQEVRLSHDL